MVGDLGTTRLRRDLCVTEKYISTSLSLRRTTAPSRKPFWVLGVWVVVWVKADYFSWCAGRVPSEEGNFDQLRTMNYVSNIGMQNSFWCSVCLPLGPLDSNVG